ncbi:hypothetical protein [uncultured Imperialibacter sp.]|uniref:sugar phosphate isomerase/epimerase family protein n=1 Tax=uncultured Imperialibacter sp. TaxID=1672639 RepID=UPI0030D6FA7B|tara:strand:- start:18473 stop:19372 length:900 start_codon:yes stop_codon:yes gene_type:complete
MKAIKIPFIIFAFACLIVSHAGAQSIYSKSNLFAWCIVPYDAKHRSPADRIAMLKELGFKSYAYDWRAEHLATSVEEWKLAKKNNIKINAVWIWIDANTDSPQKLSGANLQLLSYIKETKLKTQLWVGFHANFLEGLDEEAKVRKSKEMLDYLHAKAAEVGCTVALYNHGDWLGEPANQVKVIKASGFKDVGIIYNFHHAHEQLDDYTDIIDVALPYLWAVNLNGMREEGPKILPIGSGDRESEMMAYLTKVGFKGQIGILGHIEEEDVAIVLQRNLSGLQRILSSIGDKEGLSTYGKN